MQRLASATGRDGRGQRIGVRAKVLGEGYTVFSDNVTDDRRDCGYSKQMTKSVQVMAAKVEVADFGARLAREAKGHRAAGKTAEPVEGLGEGAYWFADPGRSVPTANVRFGKAPWYATVSVLLDGRPDREAALALAAVVRARMP